MEWLRLLLFLAIGFVIGYIHTGIAIVMLFRPYRELRFLGIRLQGMIPRRKAEIARSVSRVVASDLLREESVAERIAGPEVRRAFEALAIDLAGRYLGREYGSLREILGSAGTGAVERALEAAGLELARLLQEWLASPAGMAALRSALARLLERAPADLLPGEEAALSRLLVSQGVAALASPQLPERLAAALVRLLPRLAAGDRPLAALLPTAVREAVDGAVRKSMPALLRRFEQVLLSPGNIEKIKGAVRSGLRSYLAETGGGVMKNLLRQIALLGRARIFRELDAVVDANLYRLGELVYEEENRAHLEEGVFAALEALLHQTPAQLLAALPSETVDTFCGQAAAALAARATRPEVAGALDRLFEEQVGRIFQTPLREIAETSGVGEEAVDRWAENAGQWAAGGGGENLFRREAAALVALALDTPIGRPSRFVPEGAVQELAALGLEHLMPSVSARIPEILRIVNIEGLIEREVLRLEPREVERVIVTVARRELGAIAWWGGVLGALVGGVQSALQRFVF